MGFTGSAYTLCGRLAEGMPLLEQAGEQTVAEGRKVHEALWVTRVGEAALLASRLEAAHTHAVQALTLARERQERGHQAYALLWSAKLSTIRCKAKSSQDTGVPGLRGAKHGFALNAPGA